MTFVMFSKMLQEHPIAEAAKRIKAIGFEGVDLTVRPGGHVDPAEVGTALPRAVSQIRDTGLTVPMITTAITSAEEAVAEPTVAAAVHEDIRLLKLGYWNFKPGSLRSSLDRARQALDGLERLAEKYRVTFGIHNHSGPGFVNCQPALIWILLRDRNPDHVGAYFDPGHAAVEGGDGGWRQNLELLSPHLRMVAVKDFSWVTAPGQPKPRWKHQQFPLREGIVPWDEVFETLRLGRFEGPISLHSEYKGGHSWKDLTTEQLIAQTAEDLAFVRLLNS